MHMLLVLLWRHKRARCNTWIKSCLEFSLPIFIFIMFFILKDYLVDDIVEKERVQYMESVSIQDFYTPDLVLYYPKTKESDLLMQNVANQLSLKHLENEPVHGKSRGYYSIKNNSLIPLYADHLLDDEAIVIFENMLDKCPEKLNYTIKMKNDFKTTEYLPPNEKLESHSAFGTMYESFLKLQWAVDSAFLETCRNTTVPKLLSFQEFPSAVVSFRGYAQIQLFHIAFTSAVLIIFMYHTVRVMEERHSGILELVKASGVPTFLIGVAHFLNTVIVGVVLSLAGTLALVAGRAPVLARSSPLLLFAAMLLTVVTFISLAFIVAHALPLMRDASSIATFVFFLFVLPSLLVMYTMKRAGLWTRMLTGLLPMVPYNWIFSVTAEFETDDNSGLTFKTLFTKSDVSRVSPFNGYLALAIQILIYMLLASYISLVRPGLHGVGYKWNFVYKNICLDDLVDQRMDDDEAMELETPCAKKGLYFEASTPSGPHGIRIRCINKFYGRNQVLKDIDMNIYEGEITVLLGHNGAGKTTLMTIAAGLQEPSSGKVYVEGLNVQTNNDEVTKLIGMCPQENIFFKDMDVLDHAIFFTLIRKGTSLHQARASASALLGRLGLADKRRSFDAKLSGGMRRRLQLCMAMAGDARVLVLDEPTAGLDVETRRDLWNLLLTLRGNRTVILSTHFMEEADALGDRIAALHNGDLKCYATPMFLKKAIGEGYRLTLVTIGSPKEVEISGLIFEMIPDASLKEKTTNSLSYNLPSAFASQFAAVFERLESLKKDLGIESIGVGTSTLDEVFMRLCADTDVAGTVDISTTVTVTDYKKKQGLPLLFSQIKVLTWRHFKCLFYNKYNYMTFLIILPLFLICISAKRFSTDTGVEQLNIIRPMDMSMYRDINGKTVLFNVRPENETNIEVLKFKYPDVKFEHVNNVYQEALNASKRISRRRQYNKYIMGFDVNHTHATILYTTHYRHTAPVALNMLSNAYAFLREPSERTLNFEPETIVNPISVYNDPVRGTIKYSDDKMTNELPTSDSEIDSLTRTVSAVILLSITWCLAPLFLEVDNNQRHILLISGCRPIVYWTVTLLYFTLIFAAPLIPGTVVFLVIFDKSNTFSDCMFAVALSLFIILAMMVFLAFLFWLTEITTEKTAYLTALLIISFFNFVIPIFREIFPEYSSQSLDFLVPPLLFRNGMHDICTTARINAFCYLNKQRCPKLATTVKEFMPYVSKCCESDDYPRDYFNMETLTTFAYLIVHLFIFMCLTIFARHLFNVIKERVCNKGYVAVDPPVTDEVVAREKQYVAEMINQNSKEDVLLVKDLHKRYVHSCGRKKLKALQGINISIKKQECFAVLGINGAGKTTLFEALTADQTFTSGVVRCNGHKYGSRKYLQSLGYCPQINSMDIFLTGMENLEVLLRLRGLSTNDAKTEAKNLLKLLAMEKHADKLTWRYSGGCRRRLAAAGALCGARLSVLDEPSCGVDVAARRALWAALRRPHALLVASHSMEEVEALAGRLMILAGGMVRAIGTPAEIRAAHANGHSLRFLLNAAALKNTEIMLLKDKIKMEFRCTLKDQHKTMLHYHIDETMKYSVIFNKLEDIKAAFHELLVDFSVQETTLEEVFLSFAREKNEEEQKHARTSQVRSVMI